MSLSVTRDPAMLAYLLTGELYIVPDEDLPAGSPEAAQEAPGRSPEPLHAGEPADRPEIKQATVIVDYPGSPPSAGLPAADQEYLNKILASVGLKQDDVMILNHALAPETGFEQLKASSNCSRLLIFGVAPETLNIPAPVNPYSVTRLDGIDILASDRMEQLRPDVAKRKQLWNELRKMFREGGK